jgi:hypothetical protein
MEMGQLRSQILPLRFALSVLPLFRRNDQVGQNESTASCEGDPLSIK